MTTPFTPHQIAALLNVSASRVTQLKKSGMPFDPAGFGAWWRDREGSNSTRLDASEQKARVDKERADMLAMQNQVTRSELIPAGDVEQAVATAFAAIAQDLRAIPDNLERQHGIDGETAQRAEEAIFVAMDALAERLSVLGLDTDDTRPA